MIKPDILQPVIIDEVNRQDTTPPSSDMGTELEVIKLQGLLGEENLSIKEEDALKFIIKHCKDNNMEETADILSYIRKIEAKIGLVGSSRIQAIKNYIIIKNIK